MIQFQKAHIGYQESLLEIEELTLQSGQLYILVGRNGVGKSTLLRTLIAQVPLLSGRLKVNETLIENLSSAACSHHLAYVRSTFPAVDFLRVSEYVALGRTPHTNTLGRLSEQDHSAIKKAIDTLGLNHLEHKFTTEISDGERQLVAIARAVAQETEILLLDEPTAFLDYPNKARILSLLKKIAVEDKKCVLLSSHDIELSLDAECPFLVVNNSDRTLRLLPVPVKKSTVLESAFGIRDENTYI